MEARANFGTFSAFVFELYERSHTQDTMTLLRWSVDTLGAIVGCDSNWCGWADLRRQEVEVCGAISRNLPDDFFHFWSKIKHDDLLAHDVMHTGCEVASYNRQGSRHTEGMVALSDRYNIDKLSVIVVDHDSSPISLFLSSYRSGRHAKALSAAELQFLRAAMDHVRFAIERNALCGRGGEGLLVNEAGRVLAASPEALRTLREFWPGWNGDRLPEPIAARDSRRATLQAGVRFERREAPRFSGSPLFYLRVRGNDPFSTLTLRERQIVDHIADGLTHKEIARVLGISPATVRNHTQAVLTKLGARNKAAIIKLLHDGQSS
jgi:DNA-binding CsgD family transcriptional regulator